MNRARLLMRRMLAPTAVKVGAVAVAAGVVTAGGITPATIRGWAKAP